LIDAGKIRIKPEYMRDICGVAMIRVEDMARIINDMPTIQSEPERKKGKWLRSGNCIFPYECDQCGDTNERATSFCPNCGSYNRGEQE